MTWEVNLALLLCLGLRHLNPLHLAGSEGGPKEGVWNGQKQQEDLATEFFLLDVFLTASGSLMNDDR